MSPYLRVSQAKRSYFQYYSETSYYIFLSGNQKFSCRHLRGNKKKSQRGEMFMQAFPSMRSNSCFRLHANTFSSLDHLAHYWCSAGAKSAMERCIQMPRTKEKLGRVRPKQILNQKWNWLASHDTLSSPMKEKSPLDNESQTQQKCFMLAYI